MCKEIPIFFSTDDNYLPYLDVAIASLIANASTEHAYRLIVLNTGLDPEGVALVKRRERTGVTIEFVDISKRIEGIRSRFRNVYHFSVVTYYRLFIASLFPQYDKIVYLDCDLVVRGDIAKLYEIDLGDNILGAARDRLVSGTAEFRAYAAQAVGVDPDRYVNAGVLLINLKAFRENDIEGRFVRLITEHDFDLLDPDQAYLNFLCRDKILPLPSGWNAVPMTLPADVPKDIVHYALYKKPWQEDLEDGACFWRYAESSPFYERIVAAKAAFGEREKAQKDAAAREILEHAKRIVASESTLSKIGG